MINIFSDNAPKKRRRKKRLSKEEISRLSKENLNAIHPMAVPLLARERAGKTNDWVEKTISMIAESPHKLSEKWIASINKWTESMIASISLDAPDYTEGDRYDFGPLSIVKICDPKGDSQYPMPAILAADTDGWKYFFKTTKAYGFSKEDIITFTATVSSHKEGITFLRRPSKIKKIESQKTSGEDNDS
jgi:hypothetical protein